MSVDEQIFDVIIVGAGISGSIIAKELQRKNNDLSILILEAGTGKSGDFNDYDLYNDQFYNALIKVPNSPYTETKFAPSPSVLDPTRIGDTGPKTNGYFVQNGPYPFLSNYNRNVGGTTLHWLGTTPRMCPNDFKLYSTYKRGKDWPITYEDLQPFYRRAEKEIGVSAEVADQSYIDISFDEGYVFPMHAMPQSYLDNHMKEGLKDKKITFNGKEQIAPVVSTPQGRNGMPNAAYKEYKENETEFEPVGAIGNPDLGQRCEGNSNCVPICPVQAKYSALKSLHAALTAKDSKVVLLNQSPVSKINPCSNSGHTEVVYKTFELSADGVRANIKNHKVRGKKVVLAANAIENAKLLLVSNICNTSGQVGKNLMDHLVMLTWGFMPKSVGAYRGPGSTSGIPIARDGSFRKDHSAFWIEIGNWGWNWPANAPESFLIDAVDGKPKSNEESEKTACFWVDPEDGQTKCKAEKGAACCLVNAENKPAIMTEKLYGKKLRAYLQENTPRQFRMGWEIEQLPNENNFISICEKYKDALGNYRPVINYEVTDYEKAGGLAAHNLSEAIFDALEVESMTTYSSNDPGYFEYKDPTDDSTFSASFQGAGHVVGTHRMGDNADDSVVDSYQRSHDHQDIFVTGAGSFVTLATSNPTLTLSALAFRTADAILADFDKKK